MSTREHIVRLGLLIVGCAASFASVVSLYQVGLYVYANGYIDAGFWRNAMSSLEVATAEPLRFATLIGCLLALYMGLRTSATKDGPQLPLHYPFDQSPLVVAVGVFGLGCLVEIWTQGSRVVPGYMSWLVLVVLIFTTASAIGRRSMWTQPYVERILFAGLCALLAYYWSGVYPETWNPHWYRDLLAVPRMLALGLLITLIAWGGSMTYPMLTGEVPKRRAVVASFTLPSLLVCLLCFGATTAPTQPSSSPRSILLINIDTLRHDHTSLDPDAHDLRAPERTPRLATLAARGTTYHSAYSQAPWTMPSNASIFTGLYPNSHGAIGLNGWLKSQAFTLAEVLHEAGYATAAVLSHYYVDTHTGLSQGFEHYDIELARQESHAAISAMTVTNKAIAWLEQRPADQPFLLMAHYFDPHNEYQNHEDWSWADDYDGWIDDETMEMLREVDNQLSDTDVSHLLNLYDEEIAWTDKAIGALLDAIEAQGLLDELVIVLYADHGEAFLERGWLGHGHSLHEEITHVPLMIVDPDVPIEDVSQPVETRSIFWSLLERVGVAWNEKSPDRRLLSGADRSLPAFSIHTHDLNGESWAAMRTKEHALLYDRQRERLELYDRVLDPDETLDKSEELWQVRDELNADLQRWLEMFPDLNISGRTLSTDEIEQLKALGYM